MILHADPGKGGTGKKGTQKKGHRKKGHRKKGHRKKGHHIFLMLLKNEVKYNLHYKQVNSNHLLKFLNSTEAIYINVAVILAKLRPVSDLRQ